MSGQHLDLDKLYALEAVADQKRRYSAALDEFIRRYGPGPVRFFRAPGRVNLIGEHTDYNHGYVLPVALDRDVLLLLRPTDIAEIRLSNMEAEFPDSTFAISENIPPAPAGDWSNYARGVAQEMARSASGPFTGFVGLVSSDPSLGVPRGAGLSSSSALTVVAAVALATINQLDFSAAEMVRICSDGEWYVGTRGGIMDQCIALLGEEGKALFLDCRPDESEAGYRFRTLSLPANYLIFLVDSGVHHRNISNEFNQRVAACRAGVSLLREDFPHITHLRDVESLPWSRLEGRLPLSVTLDDLLSRAHDLGDIPNVSAEDELQVHACCRHVWSENRRVLSTVAALEAGDIEQIGHDLREAHASARDDYRISTPELDAIVSAASSIEGCVGARLTGAGWGGCVVALVASPAAEKFQIEIEQSFQAQFGRIPHVIPCRAGQGACEVRPHLDRMLTSGEIQ